MPSRGAGRGQRGGARGRRRGGAKKKLSSLEILELVNSSQVSPQEDDDREDAMPGLALACSEDELRSAGVDITDDNDNGEEAEGNDDSEGNNQNVDEQSIEINPPDNFIEELLGIQQGHGHVGGDASDDVMEVESVIQISDDEETGEAEKIPANVPKRTRTFGRPTSSAWNSFVTTVEKGARISRCKYCMKQVSSKADRLKKHKELCDSKRQVQQQQRPHGFVTIPTVSVPGSTVSAPVVSHPEMKKTSMLDFLDVLSSAEKKRIDDKLANFIYKKNLPFNTCEDPSFIELLQALRPAYTPPSRFDMSGSLLEKSYEAKIEEVKQAISGKKVTIMQDGWSSSQNDPVLVHAISDGKKTVFLSATSTEDQTKTSAYCLTELEAAITKARDSYDVKVIGCVTDNCNTMKRLRSMLQEKNPDLFIYGCNTHLLNLVGRDLTNSDLMEKITDVQKFFRNHHYESARLKILKGKRPTLAGDTRWNSQVDVYKNYIENQALYLQISREDASGLKDRNPSIRETLMDPEVYSSVVAAEAKLKPISVYLDQLQKESSTLADAVHSWMKLKNSLEFESEEERKAFKKRFKMAVTDVGIAAYMLHPRHKGDLLTAKLLERGRVWLSGKNPFFVVIFSNLQAENTAYFPQSMLSGEVVESMDPESWWIAVGKSSNQFGPGFIDFVTSLSILPASTSGLERSLSTMGNIMSKVRNRLTIDKAEKLCFVNFQSK